MLRKERHNFILQKIRSDSKVVSSDLSDELGVSEDTIRRDLRELSHNGAILKVHGGAIATNKHIFQYRKEEIVDYELKNIVALKAVPMIKDNSVIIMSGGTTNLELASVLPPELKATIYTYSLPIAMQLTEHPNIELIFIGGKMRKTAQVTIGLDVVTAIKNIRADFCFLGVSGLDVNAGLTETDWEVAHIKKAMISISNKTILLSTAAKLGIIQRYLIETPDNLDTIITDAPANDPRIEVFSKMGIEVY